MSVIERIDQIKATTDFDITTYACPEDATGYMLEDLKNHYQTLYAVACAVGPEKILSCNLNFGYGAASLLNAAPSASFEGIHSPGSSNQAIDWAEKIVSSCPNAQIVASSGCQLQHETYDLIEVSGAGDGDYIFMTLERYACRSRWFVISHNWLSVNDTTALSFWLRKYNKLTKCAHLIPTRQGLWLIEMQEPSGKTLSSDALNYKDIEQFYTGEYFLTDCGGYPQFRRSLGKELAEPRLMAICEMASPAPGMRILDVGCGRGELAYALAQCGAQVLAIDYAEGAVDLAKRTYQELEICKKQQLVFIQQDLFAAEFDGQFDIIIAADFIEHIDAELEQAAIKKLHSFLKPGGKLIVHTAPNLLNYRYTYKRRRLLAHQAGSYLPPNPRSFYEQIVHINEQTPARLKRLLRKSFASTLTWVASDLDPCGTLLNKSRHEILIKGLSVFSVASDLPVSQDEITRKLSRLQARLHWPGATESATEKFDTVLDHRQENRRWHKLFKRFASAAGTVIENLSSATNRKKDN